MANSAPLSPLSGSSSGSGSGGSELGVDEEAILNCVTQLVLEYAQNVPAERPLRSSLSLRKDLAIESLSLISLTLRLGEELGGDVVALGLELGTLETVGDLLNLGRSLSTSSEKP